MTSHARIAGKANAVRHVIALISLVLAASIVLQTSTAFAVSGAVKRACKSDYFAFCSHHAVGSSGLRNCMRQAGGKLSKQCVSALVADGQVTKSDKARFAGKTR